MGAAHNSWPSMRLARYSERTTLTSTTSSPGSSRDTSCLATRCRHGRESTGCSVLPNEQVDPASGNLTVVATDLVLPGNAGLDIRVTRVYNSAVYPDYTNGSTQIEEDSWAGIG
jgi:hypothetical protein